MYDETTTVQYKGENILAVALRHKAFNVRVFGSVARGVVDDSSHIDLLVDYDLQKINLGSQAMLLMDLQDILGCKVDIMTEQGLSRLIKDRVLAEAKYFVDFSL